MSKILFGTHVVAIDTNAVSLDISHAFLLFSSDDNASNDDLIFRVGPSDGIGGIFEIENSTSYAISKDNPAVWGAQYDIDNPSQYYAFSTLDIGTRDALDVWNILSGVVSQIGSYEFNYNPLVTNSNTFIRTLLEVMDIYVVPPSYQNGEDPIFPGGSITLTYDPTAERSMNYIIAGSNQDDRLHALSDEINEFKGPGDTLYGLDGNDTLFDGNRSDFIDPGKGDNYIILQELDGSEDVIILEPGAQNNIWGGSEEDRIAIRLSDLTTISGTPLGNDTQALAIKGGFLSPESNGGYSQYGGLEDIFGRDYTTLDIQVDYTKNEDTLYAAVVVNPGGSWASEAWVLYDSISANFIIHDFEEGDLGIYLKPLVSDGVSVYEDASDVTYFNNNGKFLDVPGEYII